eukprot:921273-Heterocapsa_arctica.AAC.1
MGRARPLTRRAGAMPRSGCAEGTEERPPSRLQGTGPGVGHPWRPVQGHGRRSCKAGAQGRCGDLLHPHGRVQHRHPACPDDALVHEGRVHWPPHRLQEQVIAAGH